jgi:hypothetical protein
VDFVEDFQNAGMGFTEVNDAISFVSKFAARGGVAETLKAGLCAEVVASSQPIIALFSKLSSDKLAPGDKLHRPQGPSVLSQLVPPAAGSHGAWD